MDRREIVDYIGSHSDLPENALMFIERFLVSEGIKETSREPIIVKYEDGVDDIHSVIHQEIPVPDDSNYYEEIARYESVVITAHSIIVYIFRG